MYGGYRLHVHLCLPVLFNLFLKYGYLPKSFMHSVIVPLVKDKSDDLNYIDNYRSIAISSVFLRSLNLLFLIGFFSDSAYDKCQFGFKSGHSFSLCTSAALFRKLL